MGGNNQPVRKNCRVVVVMGPLQNCLIYSPWQTENTPDKAVLHTIRLNFTRTAIPGFTAHSLLTAVSGLIPETPPILFGPINGSRTQAAVTAATTKEGSGFAEYAGHVNTGIYIRKRSDPAAGFTETDKFARSASPFIEIRYAEVLLNLAESAAATGKLEEGYQGIRDIRARVGIPKGDGNYGVPAGLDKFGLIREILFERQIEFAYEGKRFQDMRRWMLWNDDASIQNTTCAQLGVIPLNGTRRHGIILAVKPTVYASTSSGLANDIFNPLSTKYDATKVTRTGIALNPDDTDANFNAQITKLDNFYNTNLTRVTTDFIDPTSTPTFVTTFRSKYYFIGIKQSVLKQSPYLFQTKGWADYYGADGTFDPLQ